MWCGGRVTWWACPDCIASGIRIVCVGRVKRWSVYAQVHHTFSGWVGGEVRQF